MSTLSDRLCDMLNSNGRIGLDDLREILLEEGVIHARSQTAMGDDRDECWFEVGKVVAMMMVSARKRVEGGAGLRPKTRNRATVARFRVCRLKWQLGMIEWDAELRWVKLW
jgi:hypothetical protein